MSAAPYFPFTPDKRRPDLFESLGWAEREGGPVEGVPGESAAGGGDTRATRDRDIQCRRDRVGLGSLDPARAPARDAAGFRRTIAARKRQAEAEQEFYDAVAAAEDAGDSWTVIGAALGVSR